MGSGFHGLNGVSPAISIRIYQIYVMPRFLFGLEAIVLKNKHIKQLSDFHKQCVRDLQSLPVHTATCAVYLLGGILPLEAYLDTRIATLLCMVGQDCQSPLFQIALYQYANKGIRSNSWFLYAGDRLSKYSIDPLSLLCREVTKNQVKLTIKTYWHSLLLSEASLKSTLVYMNYESYHPEKTHSVWSTVGTRLAETRKAIIKAKLLTGTYILQSNKSRFNQYRILATCTLCHQSDEDLAHFLLKCKCMADLRNEYFGLIGSIYPGFNELPVHDKIELLLEYECGLEATWDREALEAITRDYIYRLHCRRMWILNKEAPI